MNTRCVQILMRAVETSDGAGVRIRRSLGSTPGALLDPFLMLDAFGSDDAADYIAGFPPHPHRSFETVTYMLDLDVHLDPDGGFALPIDPAHNALVIEQALRDYRDGSLASVAGARRATPLAG